MMKNQPSASYNIERWMTDGEMARADGVTYWNDERAEDQKPWDVRNSAVKRWIVDQLRWSIQWCRGRGADLGAGTCWATAMLAETSAIEHIHAVEFSRYRLLTVGSKVLAHYKIPPEKVTLCVGNFYDLRLPDDSLDFVLLSEAFHHAANPHWLLINIRRVLKPVGVVVIIGEELVSLKDRIAHLQPFARQVVLSRELGDHGYSRREYHRMFKQAGFAVMEEERNGRRTRFVLQCA